MQDPNEVKDGIAKDAIKAINEDPLWDAFCEVCSFELRCPITGEPFIDPHTLLGDRKTYEGEKIKEWLKNNNTSPSFNTPLSQEDRILVKSDVIKNLVIEEFEKFKKKEAEGKIAVKQPEQKGAKKSSNAEELVTSDSDLLVFINTFKQMSKAFPNDKFKAEVLDNNLISQILFEKRQIFMLLQLVNQEWKEGYKLADDFIEAANKLFVSFIKYQFTADYINAEFSGHFADMKADLMKNNPRFYKVLTDLLSKPIVEEKKPMDLPEEKVIRHGNDYYPKVPKASSKNPNAFFPASASQKVNNRKVLRSSLDEDKKPATLSPNPSSKSDQKSFVQTNPPALQKALKENNQKFLGSFLKEDEKSPILLPLRHSNYDYLVKVILHGDSGVGKSSLLLRWENNTYTDSYISTIGVDFKIRDIEIDHKIVKMQVWDTAGERFRIESNYFGSPHAVIFVFDLTDKISYSNIKLWLQDCEKNYKGKQFTKVLVATKGDFFSRSVVDISEVEEFAKANNMAGPVFTSSKAGVGVQLAFELTARCVLQRFRSENEPKPESNKPNKLIPPQENSGSSCLVM